MLGRINLLTIFFLHVLHNVKEQIRTEGGVGRDDKIWGGWGRTVIMTKKKKKSLQGQDFLADTQDQIY